MGLGAWHTLSVELNVTTCYDSTDCCGRQREGQWIEGIAGWVGRLEDGGLENGGVENWMVWVLATIDLAISQNE